MWRHIADAWLDPIRRRNSISRIVEGAVGCMVAATVAMRFDTPWCWFAIPTGVFAEFVIYEFGFEPLGWAGYYWERGPRDGEEFTRP